MFSNYKTKFLYATIIILTILVAVTGYYAFKLKERYNVLRTNNYTEAFSNLVNYVNSVENYLAKSLISKDPNEATKTLTHIWRDSNLATVYLSSIPMKEDELSQTAKFLNQVSDYTYSLSRKSITGNELSEEDLKNLKQLYQYSISLEGTLNQLSDELYNGIINWQDIDNNSTKKFAQSVDSLNVFSDIDDNLNEYEGLIYDGAYSDHVNKVDKVGLTGDDISESEAEEIVRNFLSEYQISKIESNGFLENADIPAYDFSVSIDGYNEKYSVTVSKKGGHIVESSLDRNVNNEEISQEEANEIGKKYLESKGFPNMKETYFMKQENIVTVNYAYNDNEIIVYPDLIKVRIALDDGEILGIETTGYLNSHQAREYGELNYDLDEARERLNLDLEILSENLAVIPTEWKTEILCYEFKGKIENKEFLVYVNVENGTQENILVILETPGGTLTV